MSKKFRDCGSLSKNQLQILSVFVVDGIVKGERSVRNLLLTFYKKANFREPESRALFMGNIPALVDFFLSVVFNEARETLTKEEATSMINMAQEAKIATFDFSNAESIFDFIENQVINPLVEGVLEEEVEKTEEEIKEELEEEQASLEEERKIRENLMDDTASFDDSIDKKEAKSEKTGAKTIKKNINLFKKALYYRGGVTVIFPNAETVEVMYQSINGIDHVYTIQNGVATTPVTFAAYLLMNWNNQFIPHEAGRNTNGKKQIKLEDPFVTTLNWLKNKFSVAYGNALDMISAGAKLFSFENNTLVIGGITEVFKQKNTYFSTLSAKKNPTLRDGFGANTQVEFFAELSDYPFVKSVKGKDSPYINIVAIVFNEKTGKKEKMIISNLSPPTDTSKIYKDDKLRLLPEVVAYRENYISLLKQLQSSPNSQISIPSSTAIDKVYIPVLQSNNQNNFIYETEKERIEADLDKAKSLKLKDYKKLLGSMGYGVSGVMIDMNTKTDSAFSSGAFIAVSPFHSAVELNDILNDDRNWASGNSLNEIAIRNNINIVYLERKQLKFQDFSNALKGNITAQKRVVDGNVETDSFKVKSMLNPTQSFRILNRVALSMEAMEKKIKTIKDPERRTVLEVEFAKMVLFFFNKNNHYTLDIDQVNKTNLTSAAIKKVRKGEAIPAGLSKEVFTQYNKWKNSSINDREDIIRRIAVARYGFFTSAKDEGSIFERENKVEVLKSKVKVEDRQSDRYYENQGGMFGMDIVEFFEWIDSNSELKKVAEEAFDVSEINGKAIEFATFNPSAVSKKDMLNEDGKIARAGKVYDFRKEEIGDLNEEYLEAKALPMMPHIAISMETIMKAAGSSYDSEAKETASGAEKTTTKKARSKDLKSLIQNRKRTFREGKDSADLFLSMLSEQQAKEMTESLLGELANELEFNGSVIKLKDGIALGQVYKGLFQLHSIDGKVSEKVLRHEIFHKVLNEILDPDSYQRVIDEGQKMMRQELGSGDYTNEEVDEYLAERYENTSGTYSNRFVAKLPVWMRSLFQELRNLYRKLTGNFSEFKNLLEILESGGYKSSRAIYNNYDGSVRNKEFKDSEFELSMKLGFGNNEQEILNRGYIKFQNLVFAIRQKGLEKIYQNEELFLELNKVHMGIESSVNDLTKDFKELILEEARLEFPDKSIESIEDVQALVNALTTANLLENENLEDLRDFLKGYELMDSLREHAFDFYDFKQGVNYEYDVESDPELNAQLDDDSGQDSRLSQLADRGALSGIKTMNKRVKFHVENTETVDGKQISTSKAHEIMVRLVDDMPRGPKGEFFIADFIFAFEEKLENLSLSENSLEYKTMKALWDKFLSPDVANSFLALSIKRSDDPAIQAYYDRHSDVLSAFVSSYSTIAIQEFLRPASVKNGVKIRPTHSRRNVELKNEYNSNYLTNNFQRVVTGSEITYQMKAARISELFGGSGHISLAVDGQSFVININGKPLTIPFDKLNAPTNGYTDLNKKFINELISDDSGITDAHMVTLFRSMGFMISESMIPRYLNPTNARNQVAARKDRRKELYWHGIMSYLIMAKQMISEEGVNASASASLIANVTPEALEKLDRIGKNRTDLVAKILREELRTEAEMKVTGSMFTPTKFSEFFKELGNANAEFQIGSGSMFETIANAKHNKDKINTPLKNRVKAASGLRQRLQSEAKKAGMAQESQEYIAKEYPNLASNFYINGLVSGELNISDYWQLQTIESYENNASKSFLDMNDLEFQRLLLTGLLNGVENESGSSFDSGVYWHPADIQADRGYLPVFKADKRYRSSYNSAQGISISPDMKQGLMKVYYHGFNSALSILKQIAKSPAGSSITVNGEPLSDVIEGANHLSTSNIYNIINEQLNDLVDKNPALLKELAEHGVWQKVKGRFVLNQLILSKVNTDEDQFMAEQVRLFERFALGIGKNFLQNNNPLNNDLGQSAIYENANKDFEKQNIPGQVFTPVSFFKFKDLKEALDKGETPDMTKIAHPALFDMYMTYRINNMQIRQVMFGEIHAFKAQEGVDPSTEAAYMVEYSKRLTGAGTSKINPTFYEQVTNDSGEVVQEYSRKGINRNIRVINMETSEYLFADNPKFFEDISQNRDMTPEQVKILLEGDFEIDNGAIWSSSLFQNLLRNSMGNTEGFPIDSLMKLIHNDVDIATGHVDYDKALHVTLTAELMDQVGVVQEIYLKAMYSSGVIQEADSTKTLWDVYQNTFIATKSRLQAERAVFEEYIKARSEGRIIQEPAMYVNNRSTVKGTAKGMNKNPMQALAIQDEASYLSELAFSDRDLSTGFGGVLDLMGEITDKDIALSSQMLYLLGIVGDKNHFNVQETYKALEKLSNINSSKIERAVSKIMEKNSIQERGEAVRAWALEMIKKSYEAQGDFGAGYKLSEDSNTQSVSNPLHKNKMFGAIAAKINSGIGIRVKGFKGIQLPATNFIYLYNDGQGNIMTRKEALAKGFNEEQLDSMKQNLKYAQIDHDNKKISQTEVITGNFFAKKFSTGSKTLREVFTVKLTDGSYFDAEALDYKSIQDMTDKDGQKINPRRAQLYQDFQTNFMKIDWKENSGLLHAIEKNKKKAEKLTKQIDRLKESEDSEDVLVSVQLTKELSLIETKIIVMKNMNKGTEKVEQNNAGLVSYEVADAYLEINKTLYGVMSRIPNTGKNSSSIFRVRAFIDGYKNGVFVPAEWLEITGSDHDGDTAMFWQHGSGDSNSESMLESTINILSDYENRKEIFSDIDSSLSFVKNFAENKVKNEIENGNGYVADDLFTMGKFRANNGVGSTMTGASALVAKAYGYAYRTKMQFIAKGGDQNKFTSPNIRIGDENPMSSTDTKMGGIIPEKSISGEYVYKWLETLTNSAIDNAKYLTMGSLNIKRFNSNMQASMVFLGFSKKTIAEFYNNPVVEEVFGLAESLNDTAGRYFSFNPLEKAISRSLGNKFTAEQSMSYVANPENQAAYDRKYILHVMNGLMAYAKDFKKIQDVLKVSDQIKGTPYEQRKQFDKIRIALGFRSIGQVKDFIGQYEKASKADSNILEIEMMKRGSTNKIIDPKAVLLLNPNLMGYLKSHINFLEKTGSHLLYSEPMVRTRYLFEKLVNRDLLSRPFFKNRIDNAFYQQLATLFLDGFKKGSPVETSMNGKEFKLSSLEHRMAFIQEFKDMVWNLKKDIRYTENDFVDQLTFDGDIVEIKMSHNFDSAQDVSLLNSFNSLDQETKDNFFYYLLLTDGLVFKKHGFMKFISPDTYRNYNQFLKSMEANPEDIMDTDIINAFVHNFLISNIDMIQEFNPKFDLSEDDLKYYSKTSQTGSTYIDKEALYEAEELETGKSIKNLADSFATFNKDAQSKLKDSKREVQSADRAIGKFEDQIAEIIIKLYPEGVDSSDSKEKKLNEKGEELFNSIKNQGVVIPIEPNAKWSKKKLEQHALYSSAVELLETKRNDLKNAQNENQDLYNKLYAEKSFEEEQADNVRQKNRSPYRVMKQFDDGKSFYAVFKLTRSGNKIAWRKVYTYNGLLGHPFNGYRAAQITPVMEAGEDFASIDYDTYKKIKNGEIDKIPEGPKLKGKKTNFFTSIDENGKMDSFQLTDGFDKAESIQKLNAIAKVIKKAFPGIDIRFVSNQKGMRSKAKGFVNSGVIYINVDLATSDTPLHEVGHILIDLIEQQNPELFLKIGRLVMSHPAFEQIKAKYEVVQNNETDNVKETFVTLLGQSQEQLMNDIEEGQAPIWQRMFDSFWSSIKSSIRKMYESLGIKVAGVSEQLISELNNESTLDSFFNVIGKAVIEGKVLTDISSKQFTLLQIKHNGRDVRNYSSAEINAKIKELIELGIVTRTCK